LGWEQPWLGVRRSWGGVRRSSLSDGERHRPWCRGREWPRRLIGVRGPVRRPGSRSRKLGGEACLAVRERPTREDGWREEPRLRPARGRARTVREIRRTQSAIATRRRSRPLRGPLRGRGRCLPYPARQLPAGCSHLTWHRCLAWSSPRCRAPGGAAASPKCPNRPLCPIRHDSGRPLASKGTSARYDRPHDNRRDSRVRRAANPVLSRG